MSTNPDVPSFPPVDAHLFEMESGVEVVRGEVVVTAAMFPHARPQVRLAALLEAHVADGWVVASELTSRVAEHSDFAADASIRPRLDDPSQHDHIIDEVSFEIVNTQRPKVAIHKAEDLVARGVRRVFVIDIRRRTVLEWRPGGPVELEGVIEDVTLNSPLPVEALLGFGSVKDEMADALLTTPPPVLQAALAAHIDRGVEQVVAHMRQRVLRRLGERGVPVSDAVTAALATPAPVETWMDRVVRVESVARAEDLVS